MAFVASLIYVSIGNKLLKASKEYKLNSKNSSIKDIWSFQSKVLYIFGSSFSLVGIVFISISIYRLYF